MHIPYHSYELHLRDQCVLINYYLNQALRRIARHICLREDEQAYQVFTELFQLNLDPQRDFHRFHTFETVIARFKTLPNADEYLLELTTAYQREMDEKNEER